jgi:hypothetical protein
MKMLAWTLMMGLAMASQAGRPDGNPQAPVVQEGRQAAPGAAARAALGRMGFLAGYWEGEGWSLSRAGGRRRFWVKEDYRYRGNRDLMDMEGRFGDILPDGTRSPENEFGLGFLYFDEAKDEYRMWHYSDSGECFDVAMHVDAAKREMWYLKEFAKGEVGKFHLVVGGDGVWTSSFAIRQADQSWLQVMEFRMTRVSDRRP